MNGQNSALSVRRSTVEDLENIIEIYRRAREFMKNSGNPNQWGDAYPPAELIADDIRRGVSMAVCGADGIHGVFALIGGEDPSYRHIENGTWPDDGPYVTIHRLASDGRVHGVFRCAADFCKETGINVRVDTHADNSVMQRQIEKNGFVKCGIIRVADGSPRIAYQWSACGKDL